MVKCDWTGTGDAATWACCNLENQCGFGEGDCDSNYQCEGNLICGTDNCQAMYPYKNFDTYADCCYDPSKPLNMSITIAIYNRCGTVVTDFDWEAKTR